MKKTISLVLSVLIIVSSLCFGTTAFADDKTITASVTVKYCQTDARSILDMVNALRTGNDAWCWDSTDSEKVDYSGLSELTYDYDLEKIAMQRAAEIAISYSHTRPDGTLCFTAFDGGSRYGENIAAGYTTAKAVFDGWKEETEAYIGQGHRRNMLSKGYTAIGMACVYYNGIYYWVQEFRNPTVNTISSAANNSETAVDINILTSNITKISAVASADKISLNYGTTAKLPTLITKITTATTWPSGSMCQVNNDCTWTVENSSVVQLSSDSISAVKAGSTSIKTTFLGQDVSVPVTVNSLSISNTSISLSAKSYTYDGKAKKPSVTVKNGKTVLKAGTNYSVTYKNNTNIGTATVTITGIEKNGYSGTKTLTFKILPAKVTGLKATQTASSVTLTWTKVSGAVSYNVYSYNAKTKKYTKAATVKTNKATIKNLKSGTAYSYAVEAAANSQVGAKSATLGTATAPTAPTLKVSAGSKQAKLSWKKVTGATGYVVYYSTSKNGTYKKLAATTSTAYTAKKLKTGTTYYFKAVACKTVGKKTINSTYSAVKSVNVK